MDRLSDMVALNHIGLLCSDQGDYHAAATSFRRALPLVKAMHGRESEQAASALWNLAVATLSVLGRLF